jgi:hypothetical protein
VKATIYSLRVAVPVADIVGKTVGERVREIVGGTEAIMVAVTVRDTMPWLNRKQAE